MPAKPAKSPATMLGQNIQASRQAANLTQLALAHKIGYKGDDAGSYICRVEAGLQEPRLRTLARIAAALGVTIDRLLTGKRK